MTHAAVVGLLNNVVTSYDQTKTTKVGRIQSRTINSNACLGPSPILVADTQDDTGAALTGVIGVGSSGNRFIVALPVAANVLQLALYSFDITGVNPPTWIGSVKVGLQANAGTYTIKALKLDDSNTSSMTIVIGGTKTSTLTDGGVYVVHGVPLSDFVQVSIPTYPLASNTGGLTKVAYQYVDVVGANTITTLDGIAIDTTNQILYVGSGAAASFKIYKFSYTSPPAAATSGASSSNFTFATGIIAGLVGTIQNVNALKYVTPGHSANSGSPCVFFATNSNLYLVKTSDITNGVTAPASLITVDNNGPSALMTNTGALTTWDTALDRAIIQNTQGCICIKSFVNTDPNGFNFSHDTCEKFEALSGAGGGPYMFGSQGGFGAFVAHQGWLLGSGQTSGQRVVVAMDLYSDALYKNSYLITPVMNINGGTPFYLALLREYGSMSTMPMVQYRTSNFSLAPGAGGFEASWTTPPANQSLIAAAGATQIQFRLLFPMFLTQVPPQLSEAYLVYMDPQENSDYWAWDNNHSTPGGTPARFIWRLMRAYPSGTVPTTATARVYDTSQNLLLTLSIGGTPSNVTYSTDNGSTWNALGTVPNTVGTLIRFTPNSPPGVDVIATLRDS